MCLRAEAGSVNNTRYWWERANTVSMEKSTRAPGTPSAEEQLHPEGGIADKQQMALIRMAAKEKTASAGSLVASGACLFGRHAR